MLAGRVFFLGSAIVMKHARRGRQRGYHIVDEALGKMVLQGVSCI